MKNKKMLALFHSGIGQTTQFLPAKECLQFPYDDSRFFWYEDTNGNKYSLFEAMCKFY
jgi:hypothetical protein